MRCFALDLTATTTAQLTGLSVRTVNPIFLRVRRRLAENCERQSPFTGEVEVDESFFGPWRVRGKRGRGAYKKTIVFGMLKRGDCVYTQVVPNCRATTLQAAIRGRVALDSTILSDCLSSYHGLVDLGYAKHLRIRHSDNHFAEGPNHINGIEKLLELRQTAPRQVQRIVQTDLLLAPERMRVPLQT